MKPPRTIAQVLAEATGPILLDFDGPICSVFAGLPANTVAARLRQVLANHGAPIPEHITDEADPLQVLRYTGTLNNTDLTRLVDDELRRAELEAVQTSKPTLYVRELIIAAHDAGRPLAIVSNNSKQAIMKHLTAKGLGHYIAVVEGRKYGQPDKLKPDPDVLYRACAALGSHPSACVVIGDSPGDIHSARAAGMPAIGYANKGGKAKHLYAAGADAVVHGGQGMAKIGRAMN